ncbi:hypothetical protein [Coleofasciculus sp. FACHB-SPT9]|uniref:hypothetical protein n=1 Tax=Cyanophyceae TaxID=3028117 RepID=UPI00168796FC|nr:hypothetical protein [Coleofasciculus sp. FACHB-SPT9]MBD1889512.1 hypothetical protein [Coleofasciculus sp. FACHB-SPT9]
MHGRWITGLEKLNTACSCSGVRWVRCRIALGGIISVVASIQDAQAFGTELKESL